MSVTIEQPPAPPAQPPAGPESPRGGHRWTWPAWAKVTVIAVAAFLAVGLIGLATGAGRSTPSAAPSTAPASTFAPALMGDIPGAQTILNTDGYTSGINDLPPSSSGLDATVPSAAEGQNASGDCEVVIMTQTGSTSGTLESDVSKDASSAGMTAAVEHDTGYDTIRVTGQMSQLQQFGQNLSADSI